MKVALLGTSPENLELARFLLSEHVEIKLFDWVSPEQTLWRQVYQGNNDQWSDLKLYFQQVEILSVGKKFLGQNYPQASSSRMRDHFKVNFKKQFDSGSLPENYSEEQRQELQKSLEVPLESFEEFDSVVLGSPQIFKGIGIEGQWVANEQAYRQSESYFTLHRWWQKKTELKALSTVALVGKRAILHHLLESQPSLLQTQLTMFYTDQVDDAPTFKKIRDGLDKEFAIECEKFEAEFNTWKERPDYERVKYTKPQEPIRRLFEFEDATVLSIDQIDNQPKLYLSFEKNPYIKSQTYNWKQQELLTMGFDQVVNCQMIDGSYALKEHIMPGHDPKNAWRSMEAGFYELKTRDQIPILWSDLSSYFQKAEATV